ncbi:ExbD/TolR family protein [Simplicispira suum]|uniref:Biopolymer transporter ExbD n=1 Tax=Simplicispira suum TaxID=2109915 RepID=A0A2S0MZW0_9BURK|nr:biopolymer transporter ExbD [Simplicispira suum]AVO41415.1 biopolymer transporter ExbD [Simplicispira suum]MBW7834281.1 biopolymer transporter ExbD [Simplicispira suum]
MAFGRLARSIPARPMSDINVTPLVDVMLVLVVIFILTAPLLAGSLRLDLPRAQAAVPGVSGPSLLLELDRSGQLRLDGAQLSDAVLGERLADVAATRPETEIQLRADAAVPYGRVVELMGLAHTAGLARIAFVAETAPPAAAH